MIPNLRCEDWAFLAAGSPERANDDFVLVEGVVDVAGNLLKVNASKTDDTGLRVQRPAPGRTARTLKLVRAQQRKISMCVLFSSHQTFSRRT